MNKLEARTEEGKHMTDTSRPFAEKKFTDVKGHRMAYIDEGEGAPIVFQHGNPTSSYLWRNVMPACRGLGRLIACDLIGMGDSDKLYPSGPDRYTYAEQRDFLFALWDKLGLGNDVVFVVHDWGAALGFDWANRNRDRVQGIAYMEAIVLPLASAPLVFFGGVPLVLGGIVLWSLGVTVQQTLFKAMLTTLVSAERRATGFGTFDGVWGLASFAGSLLLGYLYDVSLTGLVVASVSLQVLAVPAVWFVTSRPPPPSPV